MNKIGIMEPELGHFLQKFLRWLRKRMLKLWNFPEEIRGFSLDIRIYPLTLLRQSIKTIKS